jgi:glycosyltransferase involved in cell wall biosynthesis
MIVRNEAAIIERCLTSVLPAIDYYVICDTGSTDDTVPRMRALFDAAGVAGEIHSTEFHDFGSARNEALDRCRASRAPFDYILLTDADMELHIENPEFRGMLQGPAYALRQTNWISYYNVRLIRRDHDARYIGMTHEFLSAGWPLARLDALWFFDHACGSSHAVKYERDIRLLTRELELDPHNARSMFFLAQTYRISGNPRQAIEWYRRHDEIANWDEELWYSRYATALCFREMGEEKEFIEEALEAWRMRPTRAEPLYALARYYQAQKRYEEAMSVAEMGSAVSFPAGDDFFIYDRAYVYGFAEEISIAGYYSASAERRAAGRAACASLATRRDVPPPVRETARRNWVFYAKSAAELFGSCEIREIDFHSEGPWAATNPSIMIDGATIEGIVRTVNYRIDLAYATPGNVPVQTRNHHVVFDDSLTIIQSRELMEAEDAPPRCDGAWVQGLEDCRLFLWRGRRFCSFTICDRNEKGRCEMAMGEIAGDGTISVHPLRGYCDDVHQKNWMPLVRGDELLFVYGTDPLIILRCDETMQLHEVARSEPPLALDHLRGGSQAVPVEGGWLYLAHEVSIGEDFMRTYLHRFVRISGDFVVEGVSEPFWFLDRQIEFAAGLAIDGERLLVTFGTRDRQAWIAQFKTAEVLRALQHLGA